MLNKVPAAPIEYTEDMGGAQAPSIDFFAILVAVLRRWKLVTAITLSASIATYGVLKLSCHECTNQRSRYSSTIRNDRSTRRSRNRSPPSSTPSVTSDEHRNQNPQVQIGRVTRRQGAWPRHGPGVPIPRLRIADLVERSATESRIWRNGLVSPAWAEPLTTVQKPSAVRRRRPKSWTGQQMRCLRDWIFSRDSYIITVSTTSQDPIKAQRLASTIANDYLASQREARQEALEHVATWLKGRVDDLQSRVLETESSIEKLKVESGIRDDTEIDNVREQQISGLNTQLMTAREEVNDKRARLEQARHVIETNGDIDSIPELTASATLSELRRKQMELNWSAAELQNKVG